LLGANLQISPAIAQLSNNYFPVLKNMTNIWTMPGVHLCFYGARPGFRLYYGASGIRLVRLPKRAHKIAVWHPQAYHASHT